MLSLELLFYLFLLLNPLFKYVHDKFLITNLNEVVVIDLNQMVVFLFRLNNLFKIKYLWRFVFFRFELKNLLKLMD